MAKKDLSKLLSSLPCPEALLCVKSGEATDMATVTTMWVSYDPVIAAVYLLPGTTVHKLVNECRNFTINVVDESQNRQALLAGSTHGDDPKKVEKLKLKLVKSKTVASPGVEGAAATYECRVLKVAACGTHDLFLGLVTNWSVNDSGKPVIRFKGQSRKIGEPLKGSEVSYPH